jgi:primase-polymerase (primpol)-like protein
MLEGTYGEISPSGQGVKFIAKGKLPGKSGTRRSGIGPDGTGALEVYDHGRFFTITGDVFGDGREGSA